VAPGFSRSFIATLRDATGAELANRPISWQSANSAVATVSSTGVVTLVTAGTTTITATSGGMSGSASVGNRFPATGGSTLVTGAIRSTAVFEVVVPAGATALTVTLGGGTGDPDLYLYRPGITAEAACEAVALGTTERCALTPASAGALPPGTWTVLVYGYGGYEGVTLTVSVTA
jgi:hypothetical protein